MRGWVALSGGRTTSSLSNSPRTRIPLGPLYENMLAVSPCPFGGGAAREVRAVRRSGAVRRWEWERRRATEVGGGRAKRERRKRGAGDRGARRHAPGDVPSEELPSEHHRLHPELPTQRPSGTRGVESWGRSEEAARGQRRGWGCAGGGPGRGARETWGAAHFVGTTTRTWGMSLCT